MSKVALFTGAWIETFYICKLDVKTFVALFTGAWIETCRHLSTTKKRLSSRSLRARGLKLVKISNHSDTESVALFTGAWIETSCAERRALTVFSRALYGRVD